MKIHFLKSNWNDVIIIESNNNYILVDTGFEDKYNAINDFFKKRNVDKISYIIITHFHLDHYGSLEKILNNYKVDNVIIKEYSGLDITDADGKTTTEEYRNKEYNHYLDIVNLINKKSKLIKPKEKEIIVFEKLKLIFYNTKNLIKDSYNDKTSKDYKKIKYNENYNSLVLQIEYNDFNILLTGDITDNEEENNIMSKLNYQIANIVNKEIDIYKVSHHGDDKNNSQETLNIYKPKYAVFTNNYNEINNNNNMIKKLKKANNKVKLLYAGDSNIEIEITDKIKTNTNC